jgi:hypothetical protein
MSKRTDKVLASHLASDHAFHKAMAEDPDNAAAHHEKAMAECTKSMGEYDKALIADSLEKSAADRKERAGADAVREPGLSRLAPPPPGIVAVPRAGSPAAAAKPIVDPLYTKIMGDSVDEEPNMTGFA